MKKSTIHFNKSCVDEASLALALKIARENVLEEMTQTIQAIDFYGWNEQTQSKIKEKVQAHLDELIKSNNVWTTTPPTSKQSWRPHSGKRGRR